MVDLDRTDPTCSRNNDHWLLQIERETYDILLDQLPWSIRVVKLPWMPKLLYVEWSL
ncbi:MAG: contractile injection system tape measure protein [Cyanobacteria bacterium J06635_1]